MPFDQVFPKWAAGELHSGSKGGPVVKDQKQAVAIYLSEKRKAASNPDYRASRTKAKHRGAILAALKAKEGGAGQMRTRDGGSVTEIPAESKWK